MLSIAFPSIDPVAFHLGPLEVRWYGISYVLGILLAWQYCRYLVRRSPNDMTVQNVDDFIVWATIGVVAGGRLGEALFYMPTDLLLHRPWEVLYLWRPGMSFHGGLLGVIIAGLWFCKKYNIPRLTMADILAASAPIGLFFGRIANFINAELYGRVTDVEWAVVFPNAGPYPRHPSQLYEAALEGLCLFLILFILERTTSLRRTMQGFFCAIFLMGYAFARILVENYKVPDAIAFTTPVEITVGQLLSLPPLLAGVWILVYSLRHRQA